MKCLKCHHEISIKDGYYPNGTPRYSSCLCDCGILLYYYLECTNLFISKIDYIDYKKKGRVNNGTKRI